jgi:ribosome-associated protein
MARVPARIEINARLTIPGSEIQVTYARSSGPGGQHVNKTSSRALLRWNLETSEAPDDATRELLRAKLSNRLTADGDLLIASERHRESGRNLQDALERFAELLRKALTPQKKRRKTRPTRGSVDRRIKEKKQRSETKKQRKPPRE